MKKLVVMLSSLIILGLAGCGNYNKDISAKTVDDDQILVAKDTSNSWYKNLPVSGGTSTYAYDIYNPQEAVGVSQYVFVGFVEEYNETLYDEEIEDFPTTVYTVKILESIKGDLIEGESYIIDKSAGISKDQKYLIIEEQDSLPLVGEVYLFRAETVGGRLLISGGNANLKIDMKANRSTLEDVLSGVRLSDIYKEYKEAAKNPIVPEVMADMIEQDGEEPTPDPVE